jgi:hypothetical protein
VLSVENSIPRRERERREKREEREERVREREDWYWKVM